MIWKTTDRDLPPDNQTVKVKYCIFEPDDLYGMRLPTGLWIVWKDSESNLKDVRPRPDYWSEVGTKTIIKIPEFQKRFEDPIKQLRYDLFKKKKYKTNKKL